MKYSVYRFTLNYHTHVSQMSIPVFRGDTAVQLYISITDGGNTYHIEDGCTAVLRGIKPDGTKLLQNCLIENNTRILYTFNKQTTSCEGVVNCEISLYGADGNLLTAPKFIIVVSERAVGDEELLSESDLSALDEIFASEAARKDAETARISSEKEREDAETARSEAEKERHDSFQTVFIRYSAHPDGTDFTESRAEGQDYIGVATAKEAPTDKSAYDWMQIACGEGTIVADTQHCYRTSDGIVLKDNSGKTVVIPLKELRATGQDADTFGLMRLNAGGIKGLAINDGYLMINDARGDELLARNGEGRKPIVPIHLPLAMHKNIVAGNGIEVSYNESNRTLNISATGGSGGSGGGGTAVKVNGEAVSEFDADTKLDKVTSTASGTRAYVVQADGSQAVLSLGNSQYQIVQRTTNGNISVPGTPISGAHAASKQYVDNKVNGTGTPIWTGAVSNESDIPLYGQNRVFTVGFDSRESLPYNEAQCPATISFKTGRIVNTSDMSSGWSYHEIGGALFPVGDRVYKVTVAVCLDDDYNERLGISCSKQENGSWVPTNDIAVISIS